MSEQHEPEIIGPRTPQDDLADVSRLTDLLTGANTSVTLAIVFQDWIEANAYLKQMGEPMQTSQGAMVSMQDRIMRLVAKQRSLAQRQAKE